MGLSRKTCVLPGKNASALQKRESTSADASSPIVRDAMKLSQNRSATGGAITFKLYDQAAMGCVMHPQVDERKPLRREEAAISQRGCCRRGELKIDDAESCWIERLPHLFYCSKRGEDVRAEVYGRQSMPTRATLT